MAKPVFKPNHQQQLMLLPPSYDELIAPNHPVRIVNAIIEGLDISSIERSYKGGGASSYHPRVLLKVIIYAYLRNTYSSRKMEQALHENIHFIWLAGGAKPDHNTLNDFRGKRLKGQLKPIFSQIVEFLALEGALSLKDIYLDGTKIEANANRYTFVWGKSIQTNKNRIAKQLKELWSYVEQVYKEEEQQPNAPNLEEITAEKVSTAIEQINEALQDKDVDKKVRQKLNYAKRNWPDNLTRYQDQEAKLNGRNSFSKTDPDATFMRMKDDHMQNGQLKPGYNVQASTNNQFIVNYGIEQTTSDIHTLKPHLEQFKSSYNQYPNQITADAGYGSEENYDYLNKREVEAYVKYNYFHKEQKQGDKTPKRFSVHDMHYDQGSDTVYCPMGQALKKVGSRKHITASGYLQHSDVYQASNCRGCPMRGVCNKGSSNKRVERNQKLVSYKQQAKELLNSAKGIAQRKRRCWEVEAVFGNIKANMNFKRFMLRGLEKVEIEMGLIAIAHNFKKYNLSIG